MDVSSLWSLVRGGGRYSAKIHIPTHSIRAVREPLSPSNPPATQSVSVVLRFLLLQLLHLVFKIADDPLRLSGCVAIRLLHLFVVYLQGKLFKIRLYRARTAPLTTISSVRRLHNFGHPAYRSIVRDLHGFPQKSTGVSGIPWSQVEKMKSIARNILKVRGLGLAVHASERGSQN